MNWEAFFTLHQDIPREGPGSDTATRQAINRLPALPEKPAVLDLGCGPGKQTLVLAWELGVPVIAIDFHQPFLDQLDRAVAAQGFSTLITTRRADMGALDFPPQSIDLIWAEGSIFILGFKPGLENWSRFLKNGGIVVASELAWLTDDPPAEVLSYMTAAYPPMTDIAGNVALAVEAGFSVLKHFILPSEDWWTEYLTPLGERAETLRARAESDPDLSQVLEEHDRESDICRRHGDSFGYVFFLMRWGQ
ncbi:MAG: class I SAM-dependent methyltransferase [Proteobacteria bacterium]|nr:class I SAM-dependent methyltransferase [Pseudomonadota bacterium]